MPNPNQAHTASDLWEEYRQDCCPGESGGSLHYRRLAFISGVVAACGTVCLGADPAFLGLSAEGAFEEAIGDQQAEEAERN